MMQKFSFNTYYLTKSGCPWVAADCRDTAAGVLGCSAVDLNPVRAWDFGAIEDFDYNGYQAIDSAIKAGKVWVLSC
jgi:hypothetical protein